MKLSTDRSGPTFSSVPTTTNLEVDSVSNSRQFAFMNHRNIDWKFLNMPWSQSTLTNQRASSSRMCTAQIRPYPNISGINSLNNDYKLSQMKEPKILLNEMIQEIPGAFDDLCQEEGRQCCSGCTQSDSYEETANLSRIFWESQSVKFKSIRGLQPLTVSTKFSLCAMCT